MVRSGQGFPLVFSFSFSRVKCKDRRKHLDGTKDGTMQTMCTREKEWSRTSFPECRCEYYHQFGIFPLFRAWNVRSFLENMIPSTSKILMERTSLFKSGARCLTPPPVPPPQTNLKSPVFEEWNGLVTFSFFTAEFFIPRCCTHVMKRPPSMNAKLVGSTCAWTKIQRTTTLRDLNLDALVATFPPGNNRTGLSARQVCF